MASSSAADDEITRIEHIGFVAQVFPWITQTFTTNEIREWTALGARVQPIALRRPPANSQSEENDLPAPKYLGQLGLASAITGVMLAIRRPSSTVSTLVAIARTPYMRFTTPQLRLTALWSWVRGIVIAGFARRARLTHLHADFADQAATVAWVASLLADVPFSFRSHTSFNAQLLERKVRDARVVLSISSYDRQQLQRTSGVVDDQRIVVSYLGVNPSEWRRGDINRGDTARLLCVGTLQEKKGQRYLILACDELRRRGMQFSCELIGDGPDRTNLEALIAERDLTDLVRITGYQSSVEVRERLQSGAVFCLPSVVAQNGDSDGIPVVLMEAMATQLVCISTRVAGIPELIIDGESGLLVPPRDVAALVSSIERVLGDEALREQIGIRARERIIKNFDLMTNARRALEFIRNAEGQFLPPAPRPDGR